MTPELHDDHNHPPVPRIRLLEKGTMEETTEMTVGDKVTVTDEGLAELGLRVAVHGNREGTIGKEIVKGLFQVRFEPREGDERGRNIVAPSVYLRKVVEPAPAQTVEDRLATLERRVSLLEFQVQGT